MYEVPKQPLTCSIRNKTFLPTPWDERDEKLSHFESVVGQGSRGMDPFLRIWLYFLLMSYSSQVHRYEFWP